MIMRFWLRLIWARRNLKGFLSRWCEFEQGREISNFILLHAEILTFDIRCFLYYPIKILCKKNPIIWAPNWVRIKTSSSARSLTCKRIINQRHSSIQRPKRSFITRTRLNRNTCIRQNIPLKLRIGTDRCRRANDKVDIAGLSTADQDHLCGGCGSGERGADLEYKLTISISSAVDSECCGKNCVLGWETVDAGWEGQASKISCGECFGFDEGGSVVVCCQDCCFRL